MFRALICPFSGVCDYVVELRHWLILFCKDGVLSVSVNLWCLVVCVWCDVCCRFVVPSNVFLLLLTVVTVYACCSCIALHTRKHHEQRA